MSIKKGVPCSSLKKWMVCLLLLCSSLGVHAAWAATNFLVIAPGQSYTSGTAPNRYNPVTQVAGESFNVSMYAYTDNNNLPYNTNGASTTMGSSSSSPSFSPASPSLTQTFATIANSTFTPVVTTLYPATSGYYTLTASTNVGAGINGDSTTIYVQSINHFTISAVGFSAGTAGTLTIQAEDSSNNLCDKFTGPTATATLSVLDAGANGATVNLGTIQFTNGVYTTSSLILYHATQYARFQVVKSDTPAVTSTSSNVVIAAGAANKWLIIGPGQSILAGQNGGNGRTGGSTTTSSQVAGTNFSPNPVVYACDAYWNTVTSAATVSLVSSDGTYSSSQGLGGSSSVTFSGVNIHTVAGTPSLTASGGGLTSNIDYVPLTSAVLDHFAIANASGGPVDNIATTNDTTPVVVKAFDVYGNTVTSSIVGTTLTVMQGASPVTVNNPSNLTWGPTSLTFSSGISSNNLFIRKFGANYLVRVANGSVTSDSNYFNVVSPYTPVKYVVIMPGQSYTPGERYGTVWGRNAATATNVTAGTPINVSVVVTDTYGNKVTSVTINANAALTRTDAGATLPSPIAIASGSAYPSFILTAAWTNPTYQVITVSDSVATYSQANSGSFTVVASSLHHFAVGNIGATQTAGSAFNAQITAQDTYNNPVTSFAGPVYISCPLLDYHSPEQSVINVTGGTNASGVTWTTSGGFTNGVWSNNVTVYRSITTTGGTANLFVSSNANGTGFTGYSSAFTVNANSMTKMFMVAPGLQYRPGTGGGVGVSTGGYTGIPDAQQMGTAFNVTVYATDAWWNQVPGISHAFHLTSQPTTSTFNGFAGGTHQYNFVNGVLNVSTNFTNADTYTITVDCDTLGIDDYLTAYNIVAISIDHFKITGFGGVALPSDLMAGVPTNVSITAYSTAFESPATIAGTFNGQTNLTTSKDYEEPFRVISPQRITFSGGVWFGPVTVYRQAPSGMTINCSVGTVAGSTSLITVHHNARKKMLIIAPGMNAKPGIAPDTYPPGGFPGYVGNPVTLEAGGANGTSGYTMSFFLCDDYWNVITNTAQGGNHSINISSSDPYPATINGSNLPMNVNLTTNIDYPAGAYTTTNFKMYKLGTNGYQTLTVSDNTDGSMAAFTLGGNGVPPINLRHTFLARNGGAGNTYAFKIDPAIPGGLPGGHTLAGVQFWCTVTAQDQFGNIMDNRNGSTAFSPANDVNLGAGSGTNTLYPTIVQLPNNGVGYFNLTLYKEYTGNSINATFSDVDGTHRGWSNSFYVDSNVFRRLIPIVPGMSTAGGGIYTSQPPTEFIGYSGSPNVQTAGGVVNLLVYSCDIYGNVTRSSTDYVSITSTDIFAPNPPVKQLALSGGYADFFTIPAYQFTFHKAAPASITATDTSNGSILSGSTPYMTVNPSAYYGLTTVAPGQILVEGSGNSGTSGITGVGGAENWYTGVTPTSPKATPDNVYAAYTEISGVNFPVTITAVDVFGNRCFSVADNYRLQSTDADGSASPRIGVPVSGTLASGIAWAYAKLISIGNVMLYPEDATNASYTRSTLSTRSDIRVVTLGETNFRIFINGIESSAVSVQAAPKTFTVRVEVRDDYNNQVVGSANVGYALTVYTNPGMSIPGNGTLALSGQTGTPGQPVVGQTLSGFQNLVVTYNVSETIYIKVTELNGSSRPTARTSTQINVLAGGPARIEMSSDAANNELQANKTAVVTAHVVDINGNAIPGDVINFTIADTFVSRLYEAPNQLTATAGISNSAGNAVAGFYAGAGNEAARIVATSSLDPTISGFLDMKISVTENGGVYPNPCNPASNDPKNWAHIDYRLDKDAPVKLYIYTLFGDLVWHKELAQGADGAKAGNNTTIWNGKNDNDVTIANGGYIAVVKVNDQQKYRFKIGVYKEK